MTKNVRIENADNNRDKRVIVEIWSVISPDGETGIIGERELLYPTTLDTFVLHDSQWLVVREANVIKP